MKQTVIRGRKLLGRRKRVDVGHVQVRDHHLGNFPSWMMKHFVYDPIDVVAVVGDV
jgi:hypothetical protein